MIYKELYDMRIRTIVMFIVILVGLVLSIAMKPYTAEMFQGLAGEVANMPEFLKGLVGDPEELVALIDDNDAYLLSQWQGKNLGQFIPFIVLIIAFPIFARETDKKTMYFLLARKNRNQIFMVKYFTGLLVAASVVSLLGIAGPVGMNIAGYNTGFGQSFMALVHELTGAFFFYSIFSFLSVTSNDQIKPIIGGIVILIGLPFFSMIKVLDFLNPYTYILSISIARGDGIDWIYSLVLLAISISLTLVNKTIFEKREF